MKSGLNETYCAATGTAPSPKGADLIKAIIKICHKVKSEVFTSQEQCLPLRRKYHCAAYNTMITLMIATQEKANLFYSFLFKEVASKGEAIWDNIIDLERSHSFEVETDFERVLHRGLFSQRVGVRAR